MGTSSSHSSPKGWSNVSNKYDLPECGSEIVLKEIFKSLGENYEKKLVDDAVAESLYEILDNAKRICESDLSFFIKEFNIGPEQKAPITNFISKIINKINDETSHKKINSIQGEISLSATSKTAFDIASKEISHSLEINASDMRDNIINQFKSFGQEGIAEKFIINYFSEIIIYFINRDISKHLGNVNFPTFNQENLFYEDVIKKTKRIIQNKEIKDTISEFRKIKIEEGIKIRSDLLKLLQITFHLVGNKILSGILIE